MRRCCRQLVALWLGATVSAGLTAHAHADQVDDEKLQKVKAAFFYNFLNYTVWQAEDLPDDDTPIVVAFVDAPKVAQSFLKATRDRKVGRHGVLVREVRTPNNDGALASQEAEALRRELSDCHAMYVGGRSVRVESILAAALRPGLMVTSDVSRTAEAGAAIELALDRDKQKMFFRVNLDAAKRARLKISSKLLRLAKIVRDGSAVKQSSRARIAVAQAGEARAPAED